MATHFTNRLRVARRLAGLGAIALGALAATASPALANGSSAQRQAAKTITMRFYVVTTSFAYTRADGKVMPNPPRTPAAGDRIELTDAEYRGTHASHAKKPSGTGHTICIFGSAKPAPTCDGQGAMGGNQLLLFHTPGGSSTVVSGGTGRFAGATGTVSSTEIGNTNNTDIVVRVRLRG